MGEVKVQMMIDSTIAVMKLPVHLYSSLGRKSDLTFSNPKSKVTADTAAIVSIPVRNAASKAVTDMASSITVCMKNIFLCLYLYPMDS